MILAKAKLNFKTRSIQKDNVFTAIGHKKEADKFLLITYLVKKKGLRIQICNAVPQDVKEFFWKAFLLGDLGQSHEIEALSKRARRL